MSSTLLPTSVLAIRPATANDGPALERLAALDSSAVLVGPALLGLVDGRPLAAVSLATGAVVADPFSPTAELVALLRQRAARLQAACAPARERRLGATLERLLRSAPWPAR